LDASNFKSYDELKAKLDLVLNLNGGDVPPVSSTASVASTVSSTPVVEEQAPWVAEEKSVAPAVTVSDDDEDDEAMSYFSKLAADD